MAGRAEGLRGAGGGGAQVEAEAAEKERARAEEERALAGLEAEYAATVARLQQRLAEADDQSRLEVRAAVPRWASSDGV